MSLVQRASSRLGFFCIHKITRLRKERRIRRKRVHGLGRSHMKRWRSGCDLSFLDGSGSLDACSTLSLAEKNQSDEWHQVELVHIAVGCVCAVLAFSMRACVRFFFSHVLSPCENLLTHINQFKTHTQNDATYFHRTPRMRATDAYFLVWLAHVIVAHRSPTSHRWLKNELNIRVCVFSKVILSSHVSW